MGMKDIIIIIVFIAGYWLGSVAHEADMSRNFKKTGNAKAWFFEIKCKDKE